MRKNSSQDGSGCNKTKVIRVLYALVLVVFMLSLASAYNFDNVKSYDTLNKEVTIKNSILGVPTDTIEKLTLKNNTYICGQYCSAEKEITIYKETKLIDSVKFLRLIEKDRWVESNIRNYQFYIRDKHIPKEVKDYREECKTESLKNGSSTWICETKSIGSHIEYDDTWKPYNFEIMPVGTYYVKLEGEKRPSWTYDWIITSQGIEVTEWASWVAGVVVYEKNAGTLGGSSAAGEHGVKIIMNKAFTGNLKVTNPGNTYLNCMIRDTSFVQLYINTTPIVASNCTIPSVTLTAGTTYYVGGKISGAGSYTTTLTQATYSNWTGGYYDTTGGTTIYSITFLTWIVPDGSSVNLNTPVDGYNTSSSNILFDCNASMGAGITFKNISLYTNKTGDFAIDNYTTTNGNTMNLNFPTDGYYLWSCKGCDTDNDCGWAATNRTLRKDTISPAIIILSPSGTYNSETTNLNLSLNYTILHSGFTYCNYSLDGGTNITLALCGNSTVTTTAGTHILRIYSWDASGNINSTTSSFTITSFVPGFAQPIYETSLGAFNVTMTNLIDVISITSNLIYNGTSYLATTIMSGVNATSRKNLDIPLVTKNMNTTFYWNINLYTSTGLTIINTSQFNQSVEVINMTLCNAALPVLALNFTAYDAENLSRLNPFGFQGNFQYWLGSGVIRKNLSVSDSSTDEIALCIAPNSTFYSDATIVYGDGSVNYVDGSYLFNNKSISNVTQDIHLLLTGKTIGVPFILKVQEYTQIPVTDAFIQIERYYPGTDSYTVLATVKTNENGIATNYFIPYTVDYRFTITKGGETLLVTEKQKVIPQEAPYTIIFTVGSLANPITIMDNSTTMSGLVSSLSYNYTTKNVTYSYIDSDILFQQGRLYVFLQNATGNTHLICNTTSALATDTLVCDVTGHSGVIEARGYITRGGIEQLDRSLVTDIINYSLTFGRIGLFIGMLIIISAGFMFLWSLIAGAIGINVAVILVNILHLINFGYTFIFAMIVISIIVIIALGDN